MVRVQSAWSNEIASSSTARRLRLAGSVGFGPRACWLIDGRTSWRYDALSSMSVCGARSRASSPQRAGADVVATDCKRLHFGCLQAAMVVALATKTWLARIGPHWAVGLVSRRRLPGPCNWPRCPAVTRDRYCPEHQRQVYRVQDTTRPPSSQRGYGGDWPRVRREFLAAHPQCSAHGCPEPSTEADHIVPYRISRSHDWSNLQALCKQHHSAKTMRQSVAIRAATTQRVGGVKSLHPDKSNRVPSLSGILAKKVFQGLSRHRW